MTLNQYHIIREHKIMGNDVYFGEREIDIYLCDLMAFNDKYSRKDGSNFNYFLSMYSFKDGINHWTEGNIPMVFFNHSMMTEDDICKVCRYNFYDMKGLIMDTSMWEKMRGVEFMKEAVIKK